MSFFVIGRMPVFLTVDKERHLMDLAGISADDRISMVISGRDKVRARCDAAMYERLKSMHDEDDRKFFGKWVMFDYSGKEAAGVVSRLLYDYCLFYGHCHLKNFFHPDQWDTTSIGGLFQRQHDAIMDDLLGSRPWFFPYPAGPGLELVHTVQPRKWWWRYWPTKMKDRRLSMVIWAPEVTRLYGTLNDFWITSKGAMIHCAEDLAVFPHPLAGESVSEPSEIFMDRVAKAVARR